MKQIKEKHIEIGYRILGELIVAAIVIAFAITVSGETSGNIGFFLVATLAVVIYCLGLIFARQPAFYIVLLMIGIGGFYLFHTLKTEEMEIPYEYLIFFAAVLVGMIAYHQISKWYWGRQAVAIGLCAAMVICYYQKIVLPKGLIAACLVMAVYTLMQFLPEYIGTKKVRQRAESLMPIFLLIGICTVLSPVSDKPYDWKWVKTVVRTVNDGVEDVNYFLREIFGGKTEYHVNTSGYGEDGALFSSQNDSDTRQLTVRGVRIKSGLYLKGNASNLYAFDSWEQSEFNQDYPERAIDTYQLFAALERSGMEAEEIHQFAQVVRYQVTHDKVRTDSLFTGGKTIEVIGDENILERPNQISLETNNKQYEIKVIELDYGSVQFRKLMEQAESMGEMNPADYEKVCAFAEEVFEVKLEKMISKEQVNAYLQNRNGYVVEEYSELPEGFNESIAELTNEIVEGYTTDYEKCRVVENYLSKYNYTKQIEFTKDDCAVSQFLFKSKSGYCVHFASAMAVMLRTQGIPTRYVEGFYENFTEQVGLQTFAVKGVESHAWVEAYIENFGWIRLEPTSRYRTQAYEAWQYDNQAAELQMKQNAEEALLKEETEEEIQEENRTLAQWAGFVAGRLVLALVIIYLMSLLIRKGYNIYRYKKSDNNGKKKILWNKISFYLSEIEYPQENEQTLKEYLGGITCLEEDELVEMLEIYYKSQYGRNKVTDENIIILEKATNNLRQQYLSAQGFLHMKRRILIFCKMI